MQNIIEEPDVRTITWLTSLSSALQGIHAVECIVSNTVPDIEGGASFVNELGDDYALQTMTSATNFVWRLFQQSSEANPRDVAHATLVIDNYDWNRIREQKRCRLRRPKLPQKHQGRH